MKLPTLVYFCSNKYIYSYTDHLGNVRLSYAKNGSGTEIIEENNFYPFGLKHEGYNNWKGNPAFNYGYNSKEFQQETGWNDYGARMYLSDIGRWGVIDPLSETSRRFSPYAYALNNPISFIDPDGRKANTFDTRAMQYEYNEFLRNQGGGAMSQMLGGGGRLNTSYYPGNLSGNGGGYSTFGQTQAYRDIMDAAASGGTGGLANNNGILSWWTKLTDALYGEYNMLKLKISGDLYSSAGQGNWFFGLGATLSGIKGGLNSERMYGEGIRRGISENYVLTGRNLSQFGKAPMTKATIPRSQVTKWGGIAGKASFGAGVAIDYVAYRNDEISGAKFGLNTAVGAYGLTGVGTIPAILYFGIESFYPGGIFGNGTSPGLMTDQANMQKELNDFNAAGPYQYYIIPRGPK